MSRTSKQSRSTLPNSYRNRYQNVGPAARAVIEPLEERRLMADIQWINRGDDGFEAAFGAKAGDARQLVDVAIADWEHVIQNFNYTDTSHANAFTLIITANNHNSGYGYADHLKVDAQGKPYSAEITLDTDAGGIGGGWFIANKWLPPSQYVNQADYVGEYRTTNPFRGPIDMYTTILHEIGHAVGVNNGKGVVGPELKINQYLTPQPDGTQLFSRNGVTATMTADGHIVGDDLMRQSQQERRRRQITPLDAKVLREGYGYTVWDPNDLVKIGEVPPYWPTFCNYYDLSLEPGEGCTASYVSVAPQIAEIADITANEGDLITFQASAVDDNPGSVFNFSLVNGPAGATINPQTGEFSFTPTDGPGSYNITVKVGDGGGCGCGGPTDTTMYDTETMTITVGNVAPTAGVAAPAVAVRGQHVPFTLTATDPSSVDAATGFTYLVDWGDGTAPQTYDPSANNGAGKAVNHAFAADGTYNVKVTATDKDGGASTEVTRQITIAQSAVLPDPGDPTKSAFFLGGTAGDDTIRVTTKGITVNGEAVSIPAEVGRLIFFGQDGDDVIDMNGTFDMPVILDGGAGSDSLSGGCADDILLGGTGDDVLKGHLGRDLLIGGDGEDDLNGQQDDDILIGGATTHDFDLTALAALMSEWTRTDLPAVQRIAHLQTGGTGARNGTSFLDALSLIDDAVADDLIGGPGDNWLL